MKKSGCLGRTCGSQIICAPCGLTWDTDDNEPPDCDIDRGRPLSPITMISDLISAMEGLLECFGNIQAASHKQTQAYVTAKGAITKGRKFLP